MEEEQGTHENVHRLGVTCERPFISDIVSVLDPNVTDLVLKDENGEWRLGKWGGGSSKRWLEKINENGEWGNWCTGPGPRGERWNGAAMVGAHFLMKVDGAVCWGNYDYGIIKTAIAEERGGFGKEVIRKEDLPSNVQEILTK